MMKTLTSPRHRLSALTLILTAATLTACTTLPRPKSLVEATDRIAAPNTERLEASRPNLIHEARQLEADARRAYARGDIEAAEINARMAIQRLETAAHFEARDEALGRLKAMTASLEEVNSEREKVERENQALQRFRQSDLEFNRLEQELSQIRANDRSEQAEARRTLVTARKRQSEAIGAGAPSSASAAYNEGSFLLDTALEALNQQLFVESREASVQAIERFDAAITASAESDTARRRQAKEAKEADNKRANLANQARKAIEDAETARAGAIAQRMPEKDAAAYKKGITVLDLANSRLQSGQFDVAKSRAEEALAIFKGAEVGADSPRGKAEAAIAAAEESRAGLVGMGITNLGATQQADYNLELARQAVKQADYERAQKLAEAAKKDYDGILAFAPRLGLGGNAQAGGGQAPFSNNFFAGGGFGGPQPGRQPQYDPLHREVEQMVIKVQVERAEALGQQKDLTCPAVFREFEAFVELAAGQLKDGNLHQAVQMATLASERLKKCGADAPSPDKAAGAKAAQGAAKAAKAPANDATALTAAEKKDKADAETALTRAQILFARALANKTPADSFEEHAMLMANAQQWFERGAWVQSATFSKEIIRLLEPTGQETAGNKAPAKDKAAPPRGAGQNKGANEPAPVVATCKDFDAAISKARISQTAAGTRVDGQDEEQRYRRGITLTLSAQRFAKEGRCQDADMLLAEAIVIFDEIARIEDKAAPDQIEPVVKVTAPLTPKDPPKTACTALDKKIHDTQLTQSLTAAKVTNKEQEALYRDAASMLQSSEEMALKGMCKEATAMLDASARLFAVVPTRASTPAADKGADKGAADNNRPAPVRDPAAEADAMDAIARAQILRANREHARSSNVYRTGDKLLADSQRLLSQGRALEASRLARQASFAFDSLPSAGSGSGAPKVEEPWKPAYQQILDALVLRDRSEDAMKSQDENEAHNRGVEFMTRSQTSWQAKDYLAAQRWARASAEEFNTVLKFAEQRRKNEAAQAEKNRELSDKDEELSDKNRELSDKDKELAAQRARAEQLKKATDAIRAAEILQTRCLERECQKRSPAGWAKGEALLIQARADLKADNFDGAAQKAAEAAAAYQTILDMKATFEMPSNTRKVKLVGNKFELQPRITFVPGKTNLTQNSTAGLRELAIVIKANLDAIARLDLIGFTDNSGNASQNLELSKLRAEEVRQALIDLGIPADLLFADGRGDADPVADNNSRQGRELNRRVEITMTLKG